MKKILFISHEASRTGAPLVLLALLRELKVRCPEERFKVLQLGSDNVKCALESEFRDVADLHVIEWKNPEGVMRVVPGRVRNRIEKKRFEQWLTEEKFDLIYANTVASLEKGVEFKHRFNVPLMLHIHESEYTCRQYGVRRECLQECDHIIAVSSSVVDALHGYGVSDERISVIRPFSENLDKIAGVNKDFRIEGVEDGDFVVGLSGAGGWRKGFDVLPLIVKMFVEKYPEVRCKFVWVGSGDRNALEYEAKRLGVEDKIILTGNVTNPLDYYNRFDVFLLTSREDPFPLVCMECGALAKPIVLFENASGIVDMIKHEESGLIVPYMNIEAMAEGVYRLYSDLKLRLKLGENLRLLLGENFSKGRSLDEIIGLLE